MLFNLKKEKIFIAGSTGMVGSAIVRFLKNNYLEQNENSPNLLTPSRDELDLLNQRNVDEWFKKNKPSIVILAAAKVGGIFANSTKPVDFLLDNLKIQNNVIEASYKYKSKRLVFLEAVVYIPNLPNNLLKRSIF